MNKIFYITSVLILLFTSCSDGVKDKAISWGVTDMYEDFLGWDYDTVYMNQTLVLDFNDDAKRLITQPIEFEIAEKDTAGKYIPVRGIEVKKNGESCKNNCFSITTNDDSISLSIIFTTEAEDREYKLYLTEKDNGGLDVIDNELELDGFTVTKRSISNPLAKGLLIGIIILAIIIVTWIVVMRVFVNPNLKFSRVIVNYGDGERRVNTGGCYKLVCTNRPIKVSALEKIFVGNIAVEVNEFWTKPLTIQCGKSRRLRILGRSNYDISADMPVRKEEMTITNSDGKSATICTA